MDRDETAGWESRGRAENVSVGSLRKRPYIMSDQ